MCQTKHMSGPREQPLSAHQPARAARSILAQWRGVDLTAQERARKDRKPPSKISLLMHFHTSKKQYQ